MGARESRSYRASELEISQIERAAIVVGIDPATLVRNAALATARRILGAAEAADPEVTFTQKDTGSGLEGTHNA